MLILTIIYWVGSRLLLTWLLMNNRVPKAEEHSTRRNLFYMGLVPGFGEAVLAITATANFSLPALGWLGGTNDPSSRSR